MREQAAIFVRLEPLAHDGYRRATVICRHSCQVLSPAPLIMQFAATTRSSNRGIVRECGCVAVVPEAVWHPFLRLSELAWQIWLVREKEASCGVKS